MNNKVKHGSPSGWCSCQHWWEKNAIKSSSLSGTVICVSVCLSDPVSSSLVQSVMSMASSHSQHSHISTDTMSSMSGSYLAGVEGEPGGDEGGDVEGEEEENQDTLMESRGPSQQDGVRNPGIEGGMERNWIEVDYKYVIELSGFL